MTVPPSKDITTLLIEWGNGDEQALAQLMPLVSDELRRLAKRYLSREHPGHTLQATALMNEAFIRLVDQKQVQWQNRAHFFGIAAQLMRRILIDHARRHQTAKRGEAFLKVTLDEAANMPDLRAAELVALDDALLSLEMIDPLKSRIVELRFFGGLTFEETAEVLGSSPITVRRHWRAAKAWLRHEINRHEGNQEDEP